VKTSRKERTHLSAPGRLSRPSASSPRRRTLLPEGLRTPKSRSVPLGQWAEHARRNNWGRGLVLFLTIATAAYVGWVIGRDLGIALEIYAVSKDSTFFRDPILIAIGLAIGCLSLWLTALKRRHAKTLASWCVLTTAAAYLYTTTQWSSDYRPPLTGASVGVYLLRDEIAEWERASVLTPPSIYVGSSGWARFTLQPPWPDSPPTVVWEVGGYRGILPRDCHWYEPPDGSSRKLAACPAGYALEVPAVARLVESGEARQTITLTVSVEAADETLAPASVIDPQLAPTVTIDSFWRGDTDHRFDRVIAGEAVINRRDIGFVGSSQPAQQWTASVEFVSPSGAALLSSTRDLALVIAGGGVTLALLPARRLDHSHPPTETRHPALKRRPGRRRVAGRPSARQQP